MSDYTIQEKTSLINDELKTISISDQQPITSENESCDSEYEDVDDEEEEEKKIITDVEELHINVKPRRLNKKREDDEHSEGYEEEDNDNQSVPNTKPKTTGDIKKTDKNKELIDDDNNTQSPAYIPRKGKFYEHDDRTVDENNRSKQEISRNENRFYKDSDAKWQHDLYFGDEQKSKSRQTIPKRDQNHFQYNNNYYREPLSRSPKGYDNQYYHRQSPYESYNKSSNNFDFKDYHHRSLSYDRNTYNRDTTSYDKVQTAPRQQRRDNDPYQVDERTFHRQRNFTNSQFQQQDNLPKVNKNLNRDNLGGYKDGYQNYEGKNRTIRKYDLYENKNNLPPRLQTNNRNLIQKQPYQQNPISNNASNIERPKRYSNMRNTMTNSIQQQGLSSQTKHYQDQRSNNIEQNDWPQAPPPPTSYLPQQLMTPQMFYQQQTSRYVSLSQQLQENK